MTGIAESGDDNHKKVTFDENIKSPKPRRKSLTQLIMSSKQNSGKTEVKKNLLVPSMSRQRVPSRQKIPSVKASATSTEDKKGKQPFKGDVVKTERFSADRSWKNLKKFEKMRKTAKTMAMIDYKSNQHFMSERKAHDIMMEQRAFQRTLDQGSDLDLAYQKKFDRIDRPEQKKIGVLGDNNRLLTTSRRSSISLYSTPQVMEVLSKIQQSKAERRKEAIKNEMKEILNRVKLNLFDVGIEYDEEEAVDENRQQRKQTIQEAFDTKAERERMEQRDNIVQRIDDFEVKAVTRKAYLTELMLWFDENMDICGDCVSPQKLSEMVREAIEMHRIITNCLNSFERTGDRIVQHGKALLEETSKIIKEKKEMLAKKTKKERIIVYDDKMLHGDQIKWDAATKTIISVFEDSFKMIKNINYKNALMLGKKQFEYMMVASDTRYKELDEKKKQCHEFQGKLHAAKMANDKLVREMEEQKRKMMKMTSEMSETKHSLDKMKDKNKEFMFKIVELNQKVKHLEEELNRILTRTPTPPPTPPPPPEPEQVIVKVVDSVTEMKLVECEAALEQSNAKIQELMARITGMEKQIINEQKKNKNLQSRVTELESIEIPERQPTPPPPVQAPPPPQPPPPPPPPPEPQPDKDATYYKTLMAGMKNEFGAEMEKMKTYMKKEKTRNEAGVRRLEQQQKEQLQGIQKDTIRMLRAIMHFRDQMVHVLEKENLSDPAQALHDLGSLIKDKLSPDPREVLAQVVIGVVDYLHKVEGILANSFLAMKIMMKHQVEKQVEEAMEIKKAKEKKDEENKKVAKDIKKRKNVLKDAKDDVSKMAKKLKKAKNKLKRYQADIEDAGMGDRLYKDLMGRYKQVWRLYKNMQKEMEMLQNDFNKTMQQKLEEKEMMIVTRLNMEMKHRRAINEEKLKISIKDQRENLKLLLKAYEDSKISKELYTLATALIEKTLEIPRRKLQHLFEQYIAFRTVKESKERVAYVLQDEELATDVRKDMESYMQQIDKKFGQSMTKWRIHLAEIENEKSTLNKKIYSLFNEVLITTGLLLNHPLLKDKDKSRNVFHAATTMDRNRMRMMLQQGRSRGFSIMMKMPEQGIKGSNCINGLSPTSMWYPQQIPPAEPSPRVTEPHMMAYEVNRQRLMSFRHVKGRVREYPLFKAESFNIAERSGVQFIREMPYYVQRRRPVICQR